MLAIVCDRRAGQQHGELALLSCAELSRECVFQHRKQAWQGRLALTAEEMCAGARRDAGAGDGSGDRGGRGAAAAASSAAAAGAGTQARLWLVWQVTGPAACNLHVSSLNQTIGHGHRISKGLFFPQLPPVSERACDQWTSHGGQSVVPAVVCCGATRLQELCMVNVACATHPETRMHHQNSFRQFALVSHYSERIGQHSS